ncbi:MAG TPA: PilZ domain-containing protein [Tepidisphaeraceae bacterium]|jgi:hypothetical protein
MNQMGGAARAHEAPRRREVIVMSNNARELLHQSIRTGAVAVLTREAAGSSGERLIVRLIPPGDGPAGPKIAADVEEGRAGVIEELIRSKAALRAAIKINPWAGITFQSILLSQERRLLGRRVTLRMPREVSVEQRRRAPRERVPQDVRVLAQFSMRPGERAAAQAPVAADVWDLSATGVCLWCRASDLPPRLQPGDPLDITLAYNGQEHRLPARFRHRHPMPNGGVRLGIEFDPSAAPAGASTSDTLQPLIDVLAQLRIRKANEQFATRSLGLAG